MKVSISLPAIWIWIQSRDLSYSCICQLGIFSNRTDWRSIIETKEASERCPSEADGLARRSCRVTIEILCCDTEAIINQEGGMSTSMQSAPHLQSIETHFELYSPCYKTTPYTSEPLLLGWLAFILLLASPEFMKQILYASQARPPDTEQSFLLPWTPANPRYSFVCLQISCNTVAANKSMQHLVQ